MEPEQETVEQLDAEIEAIYQEIEALDDKRHELWMRLAKVNNRRWELYPDEEPRYEGHLNTF